MTTGALTLGGDFSVIAEQRNYTLQAAVDEALLMERSFAVTDAEALPAPLRDELRNTFVARDGVVEKLLRLARERRVVLITGDRSAGKRTAALHLGLGLTIDESRPPLVVESLDRRVKLDLSKLVADKESFGGRATIFVNAFERNRQLQLFFGARATPITWVQLAETLARNDAYLIFTAASTTVPFLSSVMEHVAHYEWSSIDCADLRAAFARFVTWLSTRDGKIAERAAALEAQHDAVVAEFTTVPRLAWFMRQFIRDDVNLETALRRFRDPSYWFRTALDRDLEGWTFVLTLALSHAAPKVADVAWADFDRLRGAVLERLRSDPVFFGRKRRPEEDESDVRSLPDVFCDDGLLERCRAVAARDSTRLGDVLRFEHPSLASQLWDTLLAHYRRVLLSILPVLRRIAEGGDDWSVRSLAAQIIGRVGEIDPSRITLALLQQWGASNDQSLLALVGRVTEGALGSRNEGYHNVVLAQIETLADQRGMVDGVIAQKRVLTAIQAYSYVGMYQPALAMKHLGDIVIEYLVPRMADVHEVARAAELAHAEEEMAASRRSALRQRRVRLSRLADQLFADHAPVLVAIEQAVVVLCLFDDPITILRGLLDWSHRGGDQTRVLVTFLFLRDGIADDLQGVPAGANALAGTSGNRLLNPLVMKQDAVRYMAMFLLDIRASLEKTDVLPPSLRTHLQERFTACFVRWATEAVAHVEYRHAVEELFFGLATFRGGVLRGEIQALLEGDTFRTRELKAFASAVMARLDGTNRRLRSN